MGFGDILKGPIASPSSQPRGIGGTASKIWHCDLSSNKIYELDPSDLSEIRQANSPSGFAMGIGGDGSKIWHCDYIEDKVYELKTTDLSVQREAASPDIEPMGIGGDADTIWHCDINTDKLYELSTTDLSDIRVAASPSPYPNGIGGDADTIWHCDYTDRKIYELAVSDLSDIREAASPDIKPYGIGGDANTIWHCDITTDKLYELDTSAVSAPTVTHQATTNKEDTTATGNGNITDTGGETCTKRGIAWDTTSRGDPGSASPAASAYTNYVEQTGSFGTGAFTRSLTGLPTGRTIYTRAYAYNPTGGYNWSSQLSFLTKPAAPTSVAATDGVHTNKVTITWTKSTGATNYRVYEGANNIGGLLGNVATYDDSAAPEGSISNAGTVTASDGSSADYVTLSLASEATTNGATRTYKVVAVNATGNSDDSGTNTGYRSVGSITYQWQRSAADSDASYGNIGGATTDPYNDTGAPENGDGRYFQCIVSSVDASNTPQTSTNDRGYRLVAGWAGGDVLGVPIATIARINGVDLADIIRVNGVA